MPRGADPFIPATPLREATDCCEPYLEDIADIRRRD